MNHMMHWKTYLAFATGSLLLLSLPPYAAGAQNTVQQTGGSAYGQPLGRSSNPLPASSGGIPGVPSSMPSQQAHTVFPHRIQYGAAAKVHRSPPYSMRRRRGRNRP